MLNVYIFQVVFEGVRGISYRGDIALDDVRISEGVCPPIGQASCDFELDTICGYTQDTTDQFDWTRQGGSTISFQTGPATDHTLGTSVGYYMYIETSSPRVQNDKARLLTHSYTPKPGSISCLQFWYHMYGSNIGTLNVYVGPVGSLKVQKPPQAQWTKSFDHGDKWYLGHLTLSQTAVYKIMFEAIVGTSHAGDIAIDDVVVLDGACIEPGFSDFETGLSTWTNLPNDNFDWVRGTGDTPSQLTGPAFDHTLGTSQGSYMFIEATSRVQGDVARLGSKVYPGDSRSHCMNFWYHMKGRDIGELNSKLFCINLAFLSKR